MALRNFVEGEYKIREKRHHYSKYNLLRDTLTEPNKKRRKQKKTHTSKHEQSQLSRRTRLFGILVLALLLCIFMNSRQRAKALFT